MKRRIILILENQEILDLYKVSLEAYADAELTIFDRPMSAKALLEKDRKIDMIISKNMHGRENVGEDLCQFLKNQTLRTPLVIIGNEDEELKKKFPNIRLGFVEQADDVREVVRQTMEALNISAADLQQVRGSEYFPVPLNFFRTLEHAASDVFIKIGNGETEKYVKRIHEGDDLEVSAIDRYENFGTTKLYIESEHRLKFVDALTKGIYKGIESSNESESMRAEENAMDFLKSNIDNLTSPESVMLANASMKKMMGDIKGYPKIGKLLKGMLQNKSSFAYKHTKLCSYFGLTMLKEMDWAKEEQENLLSFVCLFHDISLPRDELIMINSDQELAKAELNDKEKDLVAKHAQISSTLILKYPKAPMNADIIIRQHHGSLNGINFVEHISGNLSPVSVIFMVAEECAHFVLQHCEEKIEKEMIIGHLRQRYSTSRFTRMIDALEKVID